MKRHIFKNTDQRDFFQLHGYCVLKYEQLEEIQIKLKALFAQHFSDFEEGMLVTHQNKQVDKNRKISQSIFELISPLTKRFFENFDEVIAHYVAKKPYHNEYFKLHKDWSYVNETQATPVHLWIPLQPTSKANGGFFLLPQTHTSKTFRSGSFGLDVIFETEQYLDRVKPIELGKNEFLIYHPGIYHGSYPNNTNNHRICALCSLIPHGEPLIYSQKTGKGAQHYRQDYLIDPSFFCGDHFRCIEEEGQVVSNYPAHGKPTLL